MADTLIDGPSGADATFLFAHGAGVPMDHDWMTKVADGLGSAGVRVIRFEFPYMARRRTEGKKPGPDRPAVIDATWSERIAAAGGGGAVFIGGKSFGGRMASLVADAEGVRGLVCMGYPFHPPGKPEKTRTEHLASLVTPALILQGERDASSTHQSRRSPTLPDPVYPRRANALPILLERSLQRPPAQPVL